MKHNLLKTLLVSALALGAWGGVSADTGTAVVKMTYVSGTDADVDTSFGDIAEGETARSGYNKISGGSVELGMKAWGVNYITYIQVDASEIPGTITSAKLSMDVSGSSDNKRTCTYGVGYNASEWGSGMTWSTADRTITTVGSTVSTSTNSSTKFETKEVDITAALKDDEDKIVTLLVYETAAAGGYIKNPKVTIEYAAAGAKTGTMTVHYVNSTKEELKENRTETLVEGTGCSVTEDDKKNFFTADGKKYFYLSNDADSKTISADSNTDVYVYFREANTYSYTVKSDIDGFSTTGTGLEGETVKVPYPYYLLKDGTIYETSKTGKEYNKSISLTEDNIEVTLNYSATDITDVVYLSEAEDIPGMTPCNSANTAIRSSMSSSAYAKDGDVKICTLVPGKYKITSVACDAAGKTANSTFDYKINDETVFTHTPTVINWDQKSSDEFEVNSIASLKLGQTSNSKQGIDFVYIQKTGDATTETATITEAGFATFVPTNNVTIPENVTVYTAKVDDGKVNLTKVAADAVLCGNAGYILAGAAGEYNFTVTNAAAATLSSCDLKGAKNDVTADGTQYVLAKQGDKVGFSKVETGTTIAAGKAYIQVGAADQALAKAFLAIGGNTTGIETVEAAAADNDVYYSISGVKTTRPAKGIYIHNGKKVIVK